MTMKKLIVCLLGKSNLKFWGKNYDKYLFIVNLWYWNIAEVKKRRDINIVICEMKKR